jgi:hypothetical protein
LTSTPDPTFTATDVPTFTPTPEPRCYLNLVGDNSIFRYDIVNENLNQVMDIVPNDSNINLDYEIQGGYYPPQRALWGSNGRYFVHVPLSSAVTMADESFGKGLYIYDIEEKTETAIFEDEAQYFLLDWIPDSIEFLFASDVEGIMKLYLYDLSNNKINVISEVDTTVINPQFLTYGGWSPNNRYIMIRVYLKGMPGLFLFDSQERTFVNVTYWNGLIDRLQFTWSANSQRIFLVYPEHTYLKQYDIETGQITNFIVGLPANYRLEPNNKRDLLYYYSSQGIYIIDVDEQKAYSIDIDNKNIHHNFLIWQDDSTVLGNWIDTKSDESGLFLIDVNALTISYPIITKLEDESWANDIFYYSFLLATIDQYYFIYNYRSGCIMKINSENLSIENKLCFNTNFDTSSFMYDIPGFLFSKDSQYLLISQQSPFSYVDLDTFQMFPINIDQDYDYWYFVLEDSLSE